MLVPWSRPQDGTTLVPVLVRRPCPMRRRIRKALEVQVLAPPKRNQCLVALYRTASVRWDLGWVTGSVQSYRTVEVRYDEGGDFPSSLGLLQVGHRVIVYITDPHVNLTGPGAIPDLKGTRDVEEELPKSCRCASS